MMWGLALRWKVAARLSSDPPLRGVALRRCPVDVFVPSLPRRIEIRQTILVAVSQTRSTRGPVCPRGERKLVLRLHHPRPVNNPEIENSRDKVSHQKNLAAGAGLRLRGNPPRPPLSLRTSRRCVSSLILLIST